MAEIVLQQIDAICSCLQNFNQEACEAIRKKDKQVNNLDDKVHEIVFTAIALNHPVARDLRFIISSLDMSRNIERMGDHIVSLSRELVLINDHNCNFITLSPYLDRVVNALKEIKSIFNDVITAYSNKNPDLALATLSRDDAINNFYVDFIEKIAAKIQDKENNVAVTTRIILIAKGVERIGDRITNLAESVYFINTGNKVPD